MECNQCAFDRRQAEAVRLCVEFEPFSALTFFRCQLLLETIQVFKGDRSV